MNRLDEALTPKARGYYSHFIFDSSSGGLPIDASTGAARHLIWANHNR